MAQMDGGGSSSGAEERQGAGCPKGGDHIPEEAFGRAGANDQVFRRGCHTAEHCESLLLDSLSVFLV